MEGLLGDKWSRKLTVPGADSSSEEQAIYRPSPYEEALRGPYTESNSWILTTPSPLSSIRETSNTDSDLTVALQTHNHGESDLTRLESTKDHLPGSLRRYTTPDLGSISLPVAQQLPTKAAALELVKETFTSYNKFLPIFDEEDFLQEFQVKYETSNPGDPGWWACVNIVLSLAYRLRAVRTHGPTHANTQAGGYFQNALSVVPDLSFSYRSLSAVQALVGMASILQGTPNPEPSSVLTAAALRLAQNMNMHRECSNSNLTTSQAEQRRRVFWIAYILDKDISLRLKRPFSQDDDDMDVQLPSKKRFAISDHEIESCAVNLLNYRIGLAVIQGQVYKQLYSIQARRQSELQRAIAAQELFSALSYWKSIAQPELPEESEILSGCKLSDEMIHKVVLRLTYIHCLTMIDRHLPPTTRPFSDQESSQTEPLLPSGSECLAELRKAIRLLGVIPHGDCACVW